MSEIPKQPGDLSPQQPIFFLDSNLYLDRPLVMDTSNWTSWADSLQIKVPTIDLKVDLSYLTELSVTDFFVKSPVIPDGIFSHMPTLDWHTSDLIRAEKVAIAGLQELNDAMNKDSTFLADIAKKHQQQAAAIDKALQLWVNETNSVAESTKLYFNTSAEM